MAVERRRLPSTIASVYEPPRRSVLPAPGCSPTTRHGTQPARATRRRKLAHLAGHRPADALDTELGERRAVAAALITLGLPGASYLYQGEEFALRSGNCRGMCSTTRSPTQRRTQRAAMAAGSRFRDRRRRVVRLRWPAWMPQPNGRCPGRRSTDRSRRPFHSLYKDAPASAASTLSTTPN